MTTQTIARRLRPRGVHRKRTDREFAVQRLPEYLEADEVAAIIRAADDPRVRLLILEQWRAGLRSPGPGGAGPDRKPRGCAVRELLRLGNKIVPLLTLSLARTHTMMREHRSQMTSEVRRQNSNG